MGSIFNYNEAVQENIAQLKTPEQALGKGLNIPNNATNSGSRKIMDGTHQSHTLVLSHGEMAYVSTGFENRFGEKSSSIIRVEDDDFRVIGRISKFQNAPNHHYWLIVEGITTRKIHAIERISYKHVTEMYGYLLNNSRLDMKQPGDYLYRGELLVNSIGFDEFENKTNGKNLNVAYISMDDNMEDSVVISDVCSDKMKAFLIREVKIPINENDIPLNLYGTDSLYKTFPDIGEDIKKGILLAYRREKREEAIYTEAIKRLQTIMMSDEKITLNGTVIDINIHCNNPEHLAENIYNQQFYGYYMDHLRFCREVISMVGPYLTAGYTMSDSMEKLFYISEKELQGIKYIDKRQFSNMIVEFSVLEERKFDVGDKCADRYGGKGVVSKIIPQYMMPRLPNGEYVDMIKNSSTMYNRENPGQSFELSLNYISMRILDYIISNKIQPEEALKIILRFLDIICKRQADDMREITKNMDQEELQFFISTQLENRCIYISLLPLSETISIDDIGRLYDEFPWIDQTYLTVPIKGSNGEIRYVNTRRKMIAAPQLILRLKQFAEEKFSSTSLSSTNITGDNAKSKASKNYKELYPNTPIKFGSMESGDLDHMGTDIVVGNLLIHSLSPRGRKLTEELFKGDPYNIDIHLDSKSKNRSVEKLNARLKTMGYKITFKKKKKIKKQLMTISLFEFLDNSTKGIELIKEVSENYDWRHWYKTKREIEEIQKKSPFMVHLFRFLETPKIEEEEIENEKNEKDL